MTRLAPLASHAATPTTTSFGLTQVDVRGFRSARNVAFAPGQLCALVGEANAGKSNLLAALRALLDPSATPIGRDDLSVGGDGTVAIRGLLASGETLTLDAAPPEPPRARRAAAPPILFLPASARGSTVVTTAAPASNSSSRALELFRAALSEQFARNEASPTAAALTFVGALERCCDAGAHGTVLLIEEPELYLRPQAQRYLYRLLHEFASTGNQVIYSTHSPALLNVARLDELVFVDRAQASGTNVLQPQPLEADQEFRVLTEFDAERSELFLARAAVLVEGMTEKLVLPFVFRALGHDADREVISVVECGGKPNITLFARICRAVGVPFVALHDRDAPAGRQPVAAERALNALISQLAGSDRTIVLEPDFEAVAGLRGHSHKPERAWRRFATLPAAELPPPLVRTAELALALSRDTATGTTRSLRTQSP